MISQILAESLFQGQADRAFPPDPNRTTLPPDLIEERPQQLQQSWSCTTSQAQWGDAACGYRLTLSAYQKLLPTTTLLVQQKDPFI